MVAYNDNRYWFGYGAAVRTADRLARREGRRYRVQRVTWPTGQHRFGWHIAPTPVPAPDVRVAEPCS